MNALKYNIRLPRIVYDHIPGFHLVSGIICILSPSLAVNALGVVAIGYGSWVAFQRQSISRLAD